MWPHSCTPRPDCHGLPALPCEPPRHFWCWCPVQRIRRLLDYAPHYHLSLTTSYALQPCPVACCAQTCVCGEVRALVPVWREEDDVSEDDVEVLWTLMGKSRVLLLIDMRFEDVEEG